MKIRPTIPALLVFAFAALLFAAGCDRMDTSPIATAELDEPGYRRAKELERQGRNQEAISELEKVLDKRGLNNAPETHLELGLLYQQHMRDPLAALYHFQKYQQLKPHSDREALVQQRMDVARRDYASTLPGRPSLDTSTASPDLVDLNNKLQTDNDNLRAALKAAFANNPAAASAILSSAPPDQQPPVAISSAPIAVAPAQPQPPVATTTTQPARQQTQRQQPAQPTRPAVRTYVVKQHDNLFNIARQVYGTASNAQIEAIVNANRDVLTSGRNTVLREGMTLKLP